jgi:hypothetical protein
MKREPIKHFRVDDQGVLWFKDRLVVPKDRELRNKLMDEAHQSKLSIHPKSSKMYQEMRPHYWWTKMKKEITAYVARCDLCCRVKALHMRPAELLQPLSIPDWKWEDISMDFITGLPTTPKGHNSIWVIVDRLTKSAHFLPVKTTFRPPQYAEKYIVELTTRRQMGRKSELMLFLKICLEHVCYHLEVHGNRGYLWQSLLTTTVIKRVLRWHHLKPYMVENVGHR